MSRWVGLFGLILPTLLAGQQITLTTGGRAGLARNQEDCSFQGPVRSIRIEHSEILEDGSEGKRELDANCTFDRKGQALDGVAYQDHGPYGTTVNRWRYVYDSHGRTVETDIFDVAEGTKHPRRYLVKYDSKGREWETRSLDSDGSIDLRVVTEYDSRGDTERETTYGFDDKIASVSTRHYDAAHHIVQEESRNVNPESESKKIFRYNSNGQQIEEIFDSEDKPARYGTTYDERGRPRSIETITGPISTTAGNDYGLCNDCGVFPGKRTFRYNDDGLLIEERVIQPGNNLIRLSQYAYDSHGHHTQEWVYSLDPLSKYARNVRVRVDGEDLLFDGTNGLPSISYTYDSRGNWIKAVQTALSSNRDLHSGRIIYSVTYRAIQYHLKSYLP